MSKYALLPERIVRGTIFTSYHWVWVGPHWRTSAKTCDNNPGPYREVYEWFVGPIPAGWVVDHLCCDRSCICPDHLEAVTASENRRRAYVHQFAGGKPWLRR